MGTKGTYAILRNEDGTPAQVIGPAANRNEIKRMLAPHKTWGAEATVVGSLKARTGTHYAVINGTRDGRATHGGGFWARGEQVALTETEKKMLEGVR